MTPLTKWLIIFSSSNYIIRFQRALSYIRGFFKFRFVCCGFFLSNEMTFFPADRILFQYAMCNTVRSTLFTLKNSSAKFDSPSACQFNENILFFMQCSRFFFFLFFGFWWIMDEIKRHDSNVAGYLPLAAWFRKKNGNEHKAKHWVQIANSYVSVEMKTRTKVT